MPFILKSAYIIKVIVQSCYASKWVGIIKVLTIFIEKQTLLVDGSRDGGDVHNST